MEVVIAILMKENEILKRKSKKKIKFRFLNRLFYAVICKLSEKAKNKKGFNLETVFKSHIRSIYAIDFFTVDTLFNERFYVFFIKRHKMRKIIQIGITKFPSQEFVRQQLIEFSSSLKDSVYLIHDRTGEFRLKYKDYGITGIKTSVKAPNMNSIAEQFIGSVRRELLDHFIIFSQDQLYNLVKVYIEQYKTKRAHQRIEQRIPKDYTVRNFGNINSKSTL